MFEFSFCFLCLCYV